MIKVGAFGSIFPFSQKAQKKIYDFLMTLKLLNEINKSGIEITLHDFVTFFCTVVRCRKT